MKARNFLFVLMGIFVFAACEQVENPEIDDPIVKAVFSGYVQKGPFLNGSTVTITLLDEKLNQTGRVFSTQIINNSGAFEQRNIEFASNFVELKADGFYFNEVSGTTSNAPLTLFALVDISETDGVNVNVLTHLERQRVLYLIQNGANFASAKKQARAEVLNIFGFDLPAGVSSEMLDITEDAMLLAVSVIVQGHLSTGDLSLLLANIAADIRTTGKLNNPALGSQLMNNAVFLDLNQVMTNVVERYAELGVAVEVKVEELKTYIQTFREKSGYEQTLFITYPERGRFGPNILHEGFVEGRGSGTNTRYSLTANVPKGGSLKVVVRNDNELGIYICRACRTRFDKHSLICSTCGRGSIIERVMWEGVFVVGAENWHIDRIEGAKDPFSFAFTVRESGKTADVELLLDNDFIIEFFENGATLPTRTKKVRVRP